MTRIISRSMNMWTNSLYITSTNGGLSLSLDSPHPEPVVDAQCLGFLMRMPVCLWFILSRSCLLVGEESDWKICILLYFVFTRHGCHGHKVLCSCIFMCCDALLPELKQMCDCTFPFLVIAACTVMMWETITHPGNLSFWLGLV